jgi:hypothetical protein
MPDFHQPSAEDPAAPTVAPPGVPAPNFLAEHLSDADLRAHAAAQGIAGVETMDRVSIIAALRLLKPSEHLAEQAAPDIR